MVGLSRSFEGLVVSDGVLGLAFAFADVVAIVVGVAFAIVALAFTFVVLSLSFASVVFSFALYNADVHGFFSSTKVCRYT
jgi:hypothetical protein